MSTKKESDVIKESLRPIVDSYTQMLLDGLVEDNILSIRRGKEVSYRLNHRIRGINTLGRKEYAEQQLLDDFTVFQQVVKGVAESLSDSDFTSDTSIGDRVAKLLAITQIKLEPSLLESLSDEIDGPDLDSNAVRMLREGSPNLNSYTRRILEYFAVEKAKLTFNELAVDGYWRNDDDDTNSLLITKHIDSVAGCIAFNILFRKKELDTIKEDIIKSVDRFLNLLNSKRSSVDHLILVMFSDASTTSFRKMLASFERNLRELFPPFKSVVFFVPASISQLSLIGHEFERVKDEMLLHSHGAIALRYEPEVILRSGEVMTDAGFLKATQGSFACWVKARPPMEYYERPMNFQYVISHATNDYKDVNGTYQNVFALGLAPDRTNTSGKTPTRVWWRVWISNDRRENHYLDGPVLSTMEKWYHVVVRWDHSIRRMEFLIDGKIVASSNSYAGFWPKQLLKEAFLGCWGNKVEVHYINVPLFRAISTSTFLDDEWIIKEIQMGTYLASLGSKFEAVQNVDFGSRAEG